MCKMNDFKLCYDDTNHGALVTSLNQYKGEFTWGKIYWENAQWGLSGGEN